MGCGVCDESRDNAGGPVGSIPERDKRDKRDRQHETKGEPALTIELARQRICGKSSANLMSGKAAPSRRSEPATKSIPLLGEALFNNPSN